MKFEFKREVRQEIELTSAECDVITQKYLRVLVGYDTYLRTDKTGKIVVMQDDPNHRHGSISEVYARDASDMDITIFKLLELMK